MFIPNVQTNSKEYFHARRVAFSPARLFRKAEGRKEGGEIESTSILKIELLRSGVAIITPFDYPEVAFRSRVSPRPQGAKARLSLFSIFANVSTDAAAATTFHFFRPTFPPALSLVFRSRSTQQSKWQRQPPPTYRGGVSILGFLSHASCPPVTRRDVSGLRNLRDGGWIPAVRAKSAEFFFRFSSRWSNDVAALF